MSRLKERKPQKRLRRQGKRSHKKIRVERVNRARASEGLGKLLKIGHHVDCELVPGDFSGCTISLVGRGRS